MTTELNHHFDLSHKDLIELLNIRLNIRARFIYIFENSHLLFDNLDALFATGIVFEDELFLFF